MRQSDSMRPVSGEIMVPGAVNAQRAAAARGPDFVDAEFETLAPAGPGRGAGEQGPAATPPMPQIAGLDMLRPGNAASSRPSGRGGRLFWGVGIALVLGAFWLAGGHSVARNLAALQAGGPVFRIVDVQSRVERHGGRAMLIVDGAALNEGGRAAELPGLSIDVLAENGSTTRYFLGTNAQRLDPGARFDFSGRLVAPRDGIKSVSVSFTSL